MFWLVRSHSSGSSNVGIAIPKTANKLPKHDTVGVVLVEPVSPFAQGELLWLKMRLEIDDGPCPRIHPLSGCL